MLLISAVLPLLFAAAPAATQPVSARAPVSSRAVELFESDWVLMNWALKFHDRDRDILLSQEEARAAAIQFRTIADGNADGRVTPLEFRAAREFILARH